MGFACYLAEAVVIGVAQRFVVGQNNSVLQRRMDIPVGRDVLKRQPILPRTSITSSNQLDRMPSSTNQSCRPNSCYQHSE